MWHYRNLCDRFRRHKKKIANNEYASIDSIIDNLVEMQKQYEKLMTEIETDRQTREES